MESRAIQDKKKKKENLLNNDIFFVIDFVSHIEYLNIFKSYKLHNQNATDVPNRIFIAKAN